MTEISTRSISTGSSHGRNEGTSAQHIRTENAMVIVGDTIRIDVDGDLNLRNSWVLEGCPPS
jgi:hypothetical protein